MEKLLFSSKKIQQMVEKLGDRINRDYAKCASETNPLVVVVVLRGAFFFAADLLRCLRIPLVIDFVRLSSYGSKKESSGTVKVVKDIEVLLEKSHVLIVDDIVDTGLTLSFLKERLLLTNPSSVKICTLLNKPSRRETKVEVDYFALEVPDLFVVGYGLDFNEKYRNLPEIYSLS